MSTIQDYENFLRVLADITSVAREVTDLPALTATLRQAILGATTLDVSVDDLNLSIRSRRAMMVRGIGTVRELTHTRADDLRRAKGFGMASLAEVREKLHARGLRLQNDDEKYYM